MISHAMISPKITPTNKGTKTDFFRKNTERSPQTLDAMLQTSTSAIAAQENNEVVEERSDDELMLSPEKQNDYIAQINKEQ